MKTISLNRLRSALQIMMICFCMLYLSHTVQAMGDHLTLMQHLETAPVIVAGRVENRGASAPNSLTTGNGTAILHVLEILRGDITEEQITLKYNPNIFAFSAIPSNDTWVVAFLSSASKGAYRFHQAGYSSQRVCASEADLRAFTGYLRKYPGLNHQTFGKKKVTQWLLAGRQFQECREELAQQLRSQPVNSKKTWFQHLSVRQTKELWNWIQSLDSLNGREMELPGLFAEKYPWETSDILCRLITSQSVWNTFMAMKAYVSAFPDEELNKIYTQTIQSPEGENWAKGDTASLDLYRQSFIETARKNLKTSYPRKP